MRPETVGNKAPCYAGTCYRRKPAISRTWIHLLLLIAVALLFTWPVLVHGAPDLSADAIEHARWVRIFSTQLWQGEWYPRWTDDSSGGLGAPTFFFVPPAGSYGAALFRPLLAGHDPNGWLMAGWSMVFAGLLSALTSYFWLRDLTTPAAALFGALVYTISPYHIAIDLYNRGALSEVWAFAWMPLVLLAVNRCVRGGRRAIAWLALSYALLVFTHLPTVVCFSWVIPLAVWMMSEPGKRQKAFLRTFMGIALGIAMAGAYLLPAMLDQKKSWIADLVNGDVWFYYRNNFLFMKLTSLLEYRVRVVVLVVSMLISAAVLYWIARRPESAPVARRTALLYLLAALGAFFMMTQASIPVYEVFKFVQTIQFPARFASTLTVALAALSALAYPYLARQSRLLLSLLVMLGLGWIAADAWAASTAFSVWRKIPEERAARYRKVTALQVESYQWWPKPADTLRLHEPAALEAFLAAHPARSLAMSAGSAAVESWRPRRVAIKVHAAEDGHLTIGHFYYRDWRAHVLESGQTAAVTPSPDGLIQVETPRGDHTLILELIRDTPERTGILASAASFVLICGLVVFG